MQSNSFLDHLNLTLACLILIQISVSAPCRQIKGNCAESFTEYWTCLDYSNLGELRRCRKQQQTFDNCVLDKLGWERPELGDLSKVRLVRGWLCIHNVSSLVDGLYSCWLWAVQEALIAYAWKAHSATVLSGQIMYFMLLWFFFS